MIGKTEHSHSIGNWTSLQMNIQIFLWVSNGGEPNSNSTTGKTKHFLFKNAPKKASKILQKCNSYFEQLFLDLNVSTNIPKAKGVIRKPNIFWFLSLRILDCKDKDGKWNSWILLNQLLNHNFWQILVIMYIGPQHKKGLTFKL